jgi:thiosulfate dehydrogenase
MMGAMRTALPVLISMLVLGCSVERLQPATSVPPPPPPTTLQFKLPADPDIPPGPEGVSIRRGRAILAHTRDSMPAYVGNALNCTSCHLDFGTRPFAAPWVGVYGRFPQYRTRNARMNVLEDRINDCFQRSLKGKALPQNSRDSRDIVSYMAWLSRTVPNGVTLPGQGFARLEPLEPDTARGAALFQVECVRCHGDNGQGTDKAPPLWGERSYTIGAGMGRIRTAAAFIKYNMPNDRPGSLTEQQAFDVAAYINSQPRPDLAGKENDWPNGDHPPDVPYVTRAARVKADSLRREK